MKILIKTIRRAFLLICCSLVLVACVSKQRSPANVTEAALACFQKEDIDAYCNLLYFAPDVPREQRDLEVAMAKSMISEKYLPALRAGGGIKSYEVTSEKVSDSGEKGRVEVKVVYGNNQTETINIDTRRSDDGKWWIWPLL